MFLFRVFGPYCPSRSVWDPLNNKVKIEARTRGVVYCQCYSTFLVQCTTYTCYVDLVAFLTLLMDASSPPRYRRHSSRHGLAPSSGSELPSYTRHTSTEGDHSRQATEHLFHVLNGKGKPWITLKLYSSAKSSKSLPTFFEKEKINGLLELDAEKGDSIQAITATVCAFLSKQNHTSVTH